ncbi:MAG: PKD domain-containing protein, partial [Acidobacteria bacterium]|nr:PKD domain-containing protein [Acidobacteriota bacterium]
MTVSYEQPASNPLQDAAGNAVASFSGESVTNLTERERPIANAGDDVEADPGERVTLDGSESTDPNGDRLTFAWEQTAGETVVLSGADTARLSFTAPAGSAVLTFRLTVTDPDGLSDTDEVSVVVGDPPPPRRPVADAGDDVEVAPGEVVTINGLGSYAPDGGSLSYAWEQLSGPSVELEGAASARLSFTAPMEASVLVFRLTVTSEAGLTDTDDVRAIVGGLRPPTADAGNDLEVKPGELVTLDGTGSTDPAGGGLEYAWEQTAGERVPLNGRDSARLSFTAPANLGALAFRLTVTDRDGLFDTDSVTVTIVGVPPEQPVADAGDDVEVEPGELVRFDGLGSSAPDGGKLSYAWTQLSGPSVRLEGAGSARLSFTAPREPSVLVFRLTVTSEAGRSDTDDVRAIVGGLRPPVADAGNDIEAAPGQRVTLDGTGSTDPAGYGLTFAWEQTAGERVALSGSDSARLSFTAPETPGSLTFRLQVTDRDGLFDTDKVTVRVGDRSVSFGDAEIGTLNLTVGERIEPVRLPEASGGNGTLRYSLSSQPPGFAGLDHDIHSRWLTGIPREAGTFTFTWWATDADGDTATVVFLVVVNSMPSAHAGNDIAVEPDGYVRLDGSRSADPNGDILTFAWTQIRGEQITLPDPSYVQPSFTAPWRPEALVFRLTVTDPSGLSDSDEVTVTVRDTAPTFGNTVVSPMVLDLGHEIAPVALPVATGGNGTLSYGLASDPAGLAGLDFEPATRELSGTPHTKGRFVFTYRADDEDGNREDSDAALLTFVVTVQASREARKKALTRTLAAVGSSALSSALDSIGSRFVDTTPGTSVVLGGQHISLVAADGHKGGRSPCPATGGQGVGMNGQRDAGSCGYQSRAAGWADLMSSSSFSMALNEPASPTLLGVWGGGDLMAFEGAPDPGTRYQGEA